MPFNNILCAIDFSDHSRMALERAIQLARASGGSLTLLHAVQYPTAFAFPEIPVGMDFIAQVMKDAEAELNTWAAQAERALERPVTRLVPMGVPWDEVTQEAARRGCDLVVIGSHGRTGIKRMLLGSVAEQVVRHAHCPVLVIRQLGKAEGP